MATQVYKQEVISLQDEKEVTLRPLPIAGLRRFMDAWGKFADVKDESEGFNVFVNCAGIAIEKDFKGTFESLRASEKERENGEFLSEEYKNYLEDVLDLDTIYKILEVCGGIKLTQADPKEMEIAAKILESNTDGTN